MSRNVINDISKCCGCHACYNACSQHAIEMKYDKEGFLYPKISEENCIQCDKCKAVCPILHKPEVNQLEAAYGCCAKDQEERDSSSSGGVFSVIARAVLSNGGVVCGAAYDDDLKVFHKIITKETELLDLKETKYVQSRTGDSYQIIKDYLLEGRYVLFSGVPCQVAGLKSFLGRDYDNLLCIDLICHGVPSLLIWSQYLTEVSDGSPVRKVTFRNKTKGISNITVDYYLEDHQIIQENYSESLYMKGFLQNLFVRSSCFQCEFKGTKRCSDITIGDFWAMKEYHPDQYQETGTSAVIIHSEKGKGFFSKVYNQMNVVEATVKEIACWNECLLRSVSENPKRELFYSQLKQQPLMELLAELTKTEPAKEKTSVAGRLKAKIRKIIK